MSENPNGWNHRMVTAMPCGCVTQVTTVHAISPDSIGGHIQKVLRDGYVVTFVDWQDTSAQSHHCSAYPHEPWQVDYQRRLEAFTGDRA